MTGPEVFALCGLSFAVGALVTFFWMVLILKRMSR